MKIPRYWAKANYQGTGPDGQALAFDLWGWSSESQAEAEMMAGQRAESAFRRACQAVESKSHRWYDYLDVPLREEIVDTLTVEGQEVALVTRNRYGALVLNTASVCFVDIDFPDRPSSSGLLGGLVSLFSANRRQQLQAEAQETTLQNVRNWLLQHPEHPGSLYRTAAGLRLLLTGKRFRPEAQETGALLQELGSDPLYRRLTEKQQCFRARLTPKPWRIGCPTPPHPQWPAPQGDEARRQWVRHYEDASQRFRACELLETFGDAPRDPEIRAVLEWHDRQACDSRPLPLA